MGMIEYKYTYMEWLNRNTGFAELLLAHLLYEQWASIFATNISKSRAFTSNLWFSNMKIRIFLQKLCRAGCYFTKLSQGKIK